MAEEKLYCGNLGKLVRKQDVLQLFAAYQVAEGDIEFPEGRDYCFVTVRNGSLAEEVAMALNGREVCGAPVVINKARQRPPVGLGIATSILRHRGVSPGVGWGRGFSGGTPPGVSPTFSSGSRGRGAVVKRDRSPTPSSSSTSQSSTSPESSSSPPSSPSTTSGDTDPQDDGVGR
jgi:hypothetical protein